jgi:hypothetical protein
MSRPIVEVADNLRGQGNRFLDKHEKNVGFQQLKAFRAFSAVARRRWAVTSILVPGADIRRLSHSHSCRNRHYREMAGAICGNSGWRPENRNY